MRLLIHLLPAFIALFASPSRLLAEDLSPAKIGMLLPLSGQYAAVGDDNRQGIEIAKREIDPSIKMEFIYADSKADPIRSVSEFKNLLHTNHIQALYAFRGPVGMSVNPLSKTAKLPILGGVGNKDFALMNEYAFQIWPRSDFEGEYLAVRIHEKGFKRIALITAQDDWAVAVSTGFRAKLKTLGMELAYDQELPPADLDFKSQIPRLRQAGPDAIFLNVSLGQIGVFTKHLRELGVTLPIFSNFWAGKQEVITAAGQAGDGLLFAEMSTNLSKLKADLKLKFNSTPSGATVSAYVGTLLFAQALQGMKEVTPAALYAKLLEQKEVRTRNGTFPIQDRFVQFPMTLREIRNGEVVPE